MSIPISNVLFLTRPRTFARLSLVLDFNQTHPSVGVCVFAYSARPHRSAVQRSAYLRLRADEIAFFERLYALGDPQVSAILLRMPTQKQKTTIF